MIWPLVLESHLARGREKVAGIEGSRHTEALCEPMQGKADRLFRMKWVWGKPSQTRRRGLCSAVYGGLLTCPRCERKKGSLRAE